MKEFGSVKNDLHVLLDLSGTMEAAGRNFSHVSSELAIDKNISTLNPLLSRPKMR